MARGGGRLATSISGSRRTDLGVPYRVASPMLQVPGERARRGLIINPTAAKADGKAGLQSLVVGTNWQSWREVLDLAHEYQKAKREIVKKNTPGNKPPRFPANQRNGTV